MDIFLASGGTVLLISAAIWLLKNLIVTRLTRSVESEFAKILESYRSEMRISEDRFKAELNSRGQEIAALRSGAISALASRQASLDSRRLQAVDDIWSSVLKLSPAKFISSILSVVKFEAAAEAAVHDPRIRDAFAMFDKHFDPRNFQEQLPASKARPFVNEMLWASYLAYSTIIFQAIMRLNSIKCGIGPKDFMDQEQTIKLLKTALPYYAKFIDEQGPGAYHYLLEQLEEQIIREMHVTISGVDSDADSVKRAYEVIRQSNELAKTGFSPGKVG
jgi:hypothetical protein